MQRNAVILIGIAVIASVAIGTAAFTSGSVDRAATVDVVGDDAALTGLEAGNHAAVAYDTNNQLVIDFANYSNANGVNANASYTIGDGADAINDSAFNITNNGDIDHSYTLDYTYDNTPPAGSVVKFEVYNDAGTLQADSETGDSFTLTPTESYYVVMTVNSTGTDPTDDLSGELTITVS